MSRDFTIKTIEKATEEYNKENSTNLQLPVIFGVNNVITSKKEQAYSVKTGG